MDALYAILVDPFAQMWDNPEFLLEVVIGGLLIVVVLFLEGGLMSLIDLVARPFRRSTKA